MMRDEKIESIGKVKLDMSFYHGEDLYTDGAIEDVILDACMKDKTEELLRVSTDYAVLYHLSDIRHNLVEWYPISDDENVLEIGSGCGGITGELSRKAKSVTCVELSRKRSLINAYRHRDRGNIDIIVGNFKDIEPELGTFDVITLIGVWEYSEKYLNSEDDAYIEMLRIVKKHLTEEGRLFLAIENKTGLKYWNGAFEDHTGMQYSGLNDYTKNEGVRTFSRTEIEKMLSETGFADRYFYYPVPDYKLPGVIYSDRYLPQAGEIRYFGKNYDNIMFYNFLEATAIDQICEDGMFAYFANSYIVVTGKRPDIIFAKYNRERRKRLRLGTVIKETNGEIIVEKIPLNSEAYSFIDEIMINETALNNKKNNVFNISGRINGNKYISKYAEGKALDHDFYRVRGNYKRFIDLAKEYVALYLIPDEDELTAFIETEEFKEVFGDIKIGDMPSKIINNLDCGFQNIKRTNDGSVCVFDFEWVFTFPIPYEFSIWRSLNYLYNEYYPYLKNQINKTCFMQIFGFGSEHTELFEAMEKKLIEYIEGTNSEESYTIKYKKNALMQSIRVY